MMQQIENLTKALIILKCNIRVWRTRPMQSTGLVEQPTSDSQAWLNNQRIRLNFYLWLSRSLTPQKHNAMM